MGMSSIWHWIILLVIVLALFGTKKLTKIGPDLGNAVREFRKALRDGDEDDNKPDPAKAQAAQPESLHADQPAASAPDGAGSKAHDAQKS